MTNGEAALRKFQTERYDLVLMDLQMPVLDGYDAVRAMRGFERERDRPPTPIVALTAHAMDEKLRRCLAAARSDGRAIFGLIPAAARPTGGESEK